MGGSELVLAGAIAFLASHFVLSHPLRSSLSWAMGNTEFTILYSVLATITLGATVFAFRAAPVGLRWWSVGDWLWMTATVLMLFASILMLGSLFRNPALLGAADTAATAEARGVLTITRHPMMWSFALWGLAHILVYPFAKNVILAGSIVLLALVGAALQDGKKRALDLMGWTAWERRTSYLPFVAIVQRRARVGAFGFSGILAIVGGLGLWLGASWLHIPLAGLRAGIWRWWS